MPDATMSGSAAGAPDSVPIPPHELADRLGEIPAGEVWVYCGFGYRAPIVASVVDRDNHFVVLINDFYPNAGMAGLDQPGMTDK
jgi:hydroxyacylglutathione hydrolase